jgi:DNA repair protein RecO (recombination protein O)
VDEKTTGIILRTRLLTETSLIVHWLTPDFGRIATVAKGARRAKSPFRGKLDLFYLAEFSFVRSRRSELHNLRELSVREMHPPLRREIGWLEQAAYATELIELTTETDTPLPEIFALFSDFLDHLPAHPPQPQTVFAFEVKLLRELGLRPDLGSRPLTAGARAIVQKLGDFDWPALSSLKPGALQTREVKTYLHDFLGAHLDRVPVSRNAAVESV